MTSIIFLEIGKSQEKSKSKFKYLRLLQMNFLQTTVAIKFVDNLKFLQNIHETVIESITRYCYYMKTDV